ncbi:MAG: HYR domain-containing protein [Saprospiraceae bacterium]|nr:HYR domain-containing protein [Saprospiraceae bacterium]
MLVHDTGGDPVEPTITCSESVTVPTTLSAYHATVNYSYPYHGDNCPGVLADVRWRPNSGSAFPVGGPVTVRFRVTDDAGNSAECEFAVTVEDRERPFTWAVPAAGRLGHVERRVGGLPRGGPRT